MEDVFDRTRGGKAAGSSHIPQTRTGCTLFVFYPQG
jgi:hypothetical protein